jgi:hypothetical protein
MGKGWEGERSRRGERCIEKVGCQGIRYHDQPTIMPQHISSSWHSVVGVSRVIFWHMPREWKKSGMGEAITD